MKQVVILGGGVAGLRVAASLSNRLPKYAITLVDRYDQHAPPHVLFGTAGSRFRSRLTFRNLAERFNFAYIRGVVQRISLREQTIELADRRLPYDYMVLALGSSSAAPSEHAFPASTSIDVERIKKAIAFAFQRHQHAPTSQLITIAVVGGGLEGVVMAAGLVPIVHALAREFEVAVTRVRVVCYERLGRLLPAYGHAVGRSVERYISGLGVQVLCHTSIVQVEQSQVVFEDGQVAAADVVVWTGAWRAQHVATEGGVLPLGSRGQILVNGKFQVHAFPNIFVVGDQASPPFPHRHGAVQETLAEAEYVASILPRVMQNMRVKSYVPLHRTEYVSLGMSEALQLRENSATMGWLARVGLRRTERNYKRLLGI